MKDLRRAVSLTLVAAIGVSAASCMPKKDELVIPPEGCEIELRTEDVYHYDMDLALNTEDNTVGGHVDFEFFNDSQDSWDKLCLRDYPAVFAADKVFGHNSDGELTVIENMSDSRNGAVDPVRDDGDASVIWVELSEPLAPGDKMTLSYDFTTKIPQIHYRFGYTSGSYNVTEFYPILAEYVNGEWSHEEYIDMGECFYSEVSDYHVTLEVPSEQLVASSGTEVSVTEGSGTTTYEYEAPCVRDFVFCASEGFTKVEREYEGIKVNVYYNQETAYVSGLDYWANEAFEAAENSFKAFNSAFGKYPYDEIDIVMDDLGLGGGMEYPNLIIMDSGLCTNGNENPFKLCVAHELGHQWFMGIVGSNSADEPWLDESFASYSEIVYCEYVGDTASQIEIAKHSRNTVDLTEGAADCFGLDRAYSEFSNDMEYRMAVYDIGEAFLYQLEEEVGREQFYSVIRAYVHRNAFRNATTTDFLYVLYEVVGTDNEQVNALVDIMISTEYKR